MHLCNFFVMKSYGQRCIRMPPLRGGQSLVRLCLTATIKSAAARRINPVLVGRSDGYKTRIGRWQSSRFALTSPQINSQSPSDGGLRARYASGEMLASLALAPPPSATFVPVTRWLHVGRQRSVPDRPVSLRSTRRPIAGAFLRSVHVPGGTSRSPVLSIGRTRSLRSLRSSKSILSVEKLCPSLPSRR